MRVVQLTQEALKVQCKVDDFGEWGAPTLDLPQYQRKEELQRATRFSQLGSIFWTLVEDDGQELQAGRTELLCHCESHRFDCVVRRSSGDIERGYSHHIGSVFTLPSHRKRGLAKMFLKEVAKQLEQLPGSLASVLYSDIGPTYYDKLGWRLHPSKMATLDVASPLNAKTVDGNSGPELVSLFLDDELDTFLEVDNARRVQELSRFESQEAFLVLPTRDSIQWQFCIGVHFARVRGLEELPSRCGARISADAFVLWCHNLKESALYVVRARLPDAGDNATESRRLLLTAALEEARKFQLKKVAIWDPPAALNQDEVSRHFDIEFVEREDSLSSAMIFRQEGDGDSETPLPHWLGNEKYAWV
jgi:GNAT superfamily N-acetyltransferase